MSIAVNDLAGVYRNLLASINVNPQSDDLLVQTLDGIESQVMVEGKPLALPTNDIVNNYSDSMVVFHPLCENTLLGESPVIQELRALIMDFLNDLILRVIDAVLCIAVDDELMSTLSPTQIEFMRSASGADATTLKNWRALMRRAESRASSNRVLTIFLKRGAELDGETYKRVAIVNFNLYQELTDGKLNVFGVKLRKADTKVYSKILETIFDDIYLVDKYSVGSNSMTAPYFEALIGAYHGVLKALNSPTWRLLKPIEKVGAGRLHVKDDFMEPFKDTMRYRDVLPVMPLNDGDRQTRREEENNPSSHPAPIPANDLSGVTAMARQSNPFYEPMAVVTQEPVQQPDYSQQPQYQPPQHQQSAPPPVSSGFPTLQEQLAGVPLGGFPQFNGLPQGTMYPQMMPPGYPQPAYGQPQYPQAGFAQPQYGQPQYPQAGYPQQGYPQPAASPFQNWNNPQANGWGHNR